MRCSITLYETTNQKKYLDNAENFSKKIIKNYKDKNDGGFFTTSDKTKDIIVKLKSTYDTAVPSGIGLISQSFAKLYYLTGKNNYFKDQNELCLATLSYFLAVLNFLRGRFLAFLPKP